MNGKSFKRVVGSPIVGSVVDVGFRRSFEETVVVRSGVGAEGTLELEPEPLPSWEGLRKEGTHEWESGSPSSRRDMRNRDNREKVNP